MAIRTERLKEVIRETAAEFIQHEVNDPRIGFCTVTKVDLTNDLSFATVFISVLGDEAQKRTTMRGLADARGLLQSRIARMLKTRTTPHVQIELDESLERSYRILDKIKEARASDPDQGQDTADAAPAASSDEGEEDEEEGKEDEVEKEEKVKDGAEVEAENEPLKRKARKRGKAQG